MANEKEKKSLPRRLRGVATIDEDYGVVFKPYSEGESRKEDVKRARQSSMYTTQGERKQSRVCHLTVDATAEDPVAEMLQDFVRLTKSDVVEAYAAARGKRLAEEEGLSITANRAKSLITATITIDVNKTPNFEKQLFDNFQKILKCFTINKTYLLSLRPAPKKFSSD